MMQSHTTRDTRARPRFGLAKALIGAPLAAALGWVGYSALFIPRSVPLPPAVSGERRETTRRAGLLSYYVAGSGEPLLLIHSINAAASAYEVRPLYEHYLQTRRVYAVDLPGFGFSDRSAREYSPRLYTDAILDMVDVIRAETGADSIDALALSLSSEFLARAAAEHPAHFRSLALVSPTGFSRSYPRYGPPGSTLGTPAVRDVLSFPLWSRAFFDLLNSRPSARYFLEKTFGSRQIDEGLLDYDYLTAHQPGAEYAPYAFVSGLLFSGDISRIYESLDMPVWMGHGVRGDFTDFTNTQAVEAKGNWKIQVFSTGALPHFERPEEFFSAYNTFLLHTYAGRSSQ